jgi:hypothetical protein
MTKPVDDALTLSRETRETLKKAHDLLDRLIEAGAEKRAIVSRLAEPAHRIKNKLEAELIALELLAQELGI